MVGYERWMGGMKEGERGGGSQEGERGGGGGGEGGKEGTNQAVASLNNFSEPS